MLPELPLDIIKITISFVEINQKELINYLLISKTFFKYFISYGTITGLQKKLAQAYRGIDYQIIVILYFNRKFRKLASTD